MTKSNLPPLDILADLKDVAIATSPKSSDAPTNGSSRKTSFDVNDQRVSVNAISGGKPTTKARESKFQKNISKWQGGSASETKGSTPVRQNSMSAA
jgi:hypothetical protein